jgi:hypothetical protein
MEKERHSGMFKPGQSGNPSGRPKADKTIRDISREHTEDAISTLVKIAKSSKATPTARVAACNAILDRGWGKPPQYSEMLNMDNSGSVLEGVKSDRWQSELDRMIKQLDEDKPPKPGGSFDHDMFA